MVCTFIAACRKGEQSLAGGVLSLEHVCPMLAAMRDSAGESEDAVGCLLMERGSVQQSMAAEAKLGP